LIQKLQFFQNGFLLHALFFNNLSHYGFSLPVKINLSEVLGVSAVGETSIRYQVLELNINALQRNINALQRNCGSFLRTLCAFLSTSALILAGNLL
jgi:hypothetical protein